MSARITSVTCVVALLLWGPQAAGQAPPDAAGFVVDLHGSWEIARAGTAATLPAARRVAVNAGDVIRKRGDDPAAFVIVALYTGTMMESKKDEVIVPPAPRSGAMGRVMRAIQQRFQEGFISASVRGGRDFHDAIVKADQRRTDLSDVFKGADPGAYTVTVHALDSNGVVGPARTMARIEAGAGAVSIAALAPGLYQVDISGGPAGAAGSAWIRVMPADRYGAAAREFAQLPSPGDAPGHDAQNAARGIARTYLIVLDEAPPGRP
jgi:hypothetical protein